MKITYLKLVNFSNIQTSFKTSEIEIDFSKSKNKVILFTGPNGSGKTSILSCLHPFSTNGNLDIRSDNSLILEGKDGYKEIHIIDESDEYIIKHYYTATKDSHSIKSYIERNGLELNPNGNVTSFKDLVRENLDIEPDYLKLTRLGSNVTNFIDLKTTERKSFMGKILDEVEIYLKYFKKITSDMREVKSIISHLVDKISKLSISDSDELEEYQRKLNKRVNKSKETVDDISNKISIIVYEIEKYDAPIIIKENMDIAKKKMEKTIRLLQKHGNENITIKDCEEEILSLEKSLVSLQSELSSLLEKRESYINNTDKLISERNEIEKELRRIESSSDVKDTEYMIQELKHGIETRVRECKLIDYNPEYTKKDMEEFIVMLDKCMDILSSSYEFGKDAIKKALEYIESGIDIKEYVNSTKKKNEKNKLQSAAELIAKKLHISGNNKCKDSNCNALTFYNQFYDLLTEEPDYVTEDEEFITFVKMAYQSIKNVIINIQSYQSLLKKMPKNIQDMFVLKRLINNIQSFSSIYEKEIVYAELTRLTEFELYNEDLNKLSLLKEKLKLIKMSLGNTDYFEERHRVIVNEVGSIREDMIDLNSSIIQIKEKIISSEEKIDELKELKISIEEKDTITHTYEDLKDTYELVRDLFSKKNELTELYNTYNYEYQKLLKEYNDNEYRLKTYKSLNDELSSYRNKYDDMELIKSALSSKEGIPLLYIQVYLKNIQEITNDLLEIIYDDELYIEDFNITADEFKIPYTTKGTKIKDVCYASQGERSFISLALSFALIYQSISRYNIMLLDEIDATLDTSNREKFLQILEKQMDMIEGEQIFLISHNNMFNMYPVDIIDTKNKRNEENKLSNYIQIKCK